MRNQAFRALLLAAASTVVLGSAARAQTGPIDSNAAPPAPPPGTAAAGPAPDDNRVGEVIVTAQKRAENVQNVPVAVSVVNAARLADTNVNSTETLEQLVPSLTFKRGTTNLNSTLSIRGIGTQSFSSGAEPSVSTIIDGVVLGRSGQAFQEFADVERIEVLQGPQGTLFGKNASAGALNITTKAPSKSLTGDASIAYFQGDEVRATADVSGPITDRLGGRLALVYGDYPGNATNFAGGKDANGFKRLGARGKLVWDATDKLRLTLIGDYIHADDDCCGDVIGNFVPNAQLNNIFIPALAPVNPRVGNYDIKNNFAPFTRDTNSGASLQIDYDLGPVTLTSISAYRNWRNTQRRDGDFTAFNGTAAAVGEHVASMDLDQQDVGILNFNQFSEEIRLASSGHQFIDYVVGAFFWHTDENDVFTRSDKLCSASILPVDATGFQPCAAGFSTYTTGAGPAKWDTHFDSQAVFGQATMNLTDRFRLIGGLRYTHDEVDYNFVRTNNIMTTGLPGASSLPGIAAPFTGAEKADEDGVSAKAGAQYDFAPNIIGYATYARGYKGPSLNVFYSETALNQGEIQPETSDDFEGGLKTQLFDRKLTLNFSIFYETYDNFQANSFTTTPAGSTFVSLHNAGSTRSEGVEIDGTWRITPNFSLTGGYAYDEAIITDYLCSAQLSPSALQGCKLHNGRTLPFAPKNKFNLTADWKIPLAPDIPFDLRVNSTYSYTSRINFDIDQTPLASQPSYGLWDAALVATTKDGRYSFAVIAKNLTDQYYVSFITPAGTGYAPGSYTRLQPPRDSSRYAGFRASVNF